MDNTLEHRSALEVLRYACSKRMFCDRTGSILSMDNCFYLEVRKGERVSVKVYDNSVWPSFDVAKFDGIAKEKGFAYTVIVTHGGKVTHDIH